MQHHVYLIHNDQDERYVYVGTSTDPHKRFIKHCSKSSRCVRLRNAIKKYGREHFRMEVVCVFLSPEDAYKYEVDLVRQMKSDGKILYNMTAGGMGAPGRTVRKKTREKLSTSLRKSIHERRNRDTGERGRNPTGDVLGPDGGPDKVDGGKSSKRGKGVPG